MPNGNNDRILVPGETCWRAERATRLSVITNGADYFVHLRSALSSARRAIYMVGWDFDLRIEMVPGESDADGNAPDGMPNRLGDFLVHVVEANPELSLHILKWDKAMLVQLTMQARETLGLRTASDRIHFALDSAHPAGATHHQKIVVVDDALAFCGGIDVTVGRWDTDEHRPDDPRRADPGGTVRKPWHDVTTALGGPVAAALGDLARIRWKTACGDELEAPQGAAASWPEDLDVDLEDVDVGIARTKPEYRGEERVDEIERLYLAAIAAARKTIYLESQYFASGALCRALEARMAEADGPELVVVNPDRAEGALQHLAMDTARARMIERVRAAAVRGGGGPDGAGRFRIYHPVNDAGEPIYVHAKVLIVDDRLVRIGSSNVNNRSLGFDTECDVAFETADAPQRAFALGLRHSLLAEHLGCEPVAIADAATTGGLIRAVEAMNGRAARRLVPIEDAPSGDWEREAGERLLFDERTHPRNRPHPVDAVPHAVKRAMAPYHVETVGAGVLLLGVAAVGLAVWAGLRASRARTARRRSFPAPAIVMRDRRPVLPPREDRAAEAEPGVVIAVRPGPVA